MLTETWKQRHKKTWHSQPSCWYGLKIKCNCVFVPTLWCRAVHAWRPGWSKGPLQARRLPGDNRGAAAAVWTGRSKDCETDPPRGDPNTAISCFHPLTTHRAARSEKSSPTHMKIRIIGKRYSPVSVHTSMYTWAAMRKYISENCSSVFRAFFPVKQRHTRRPGEQRGIQTVYQKIFFTNNKRSQTSQTHVLTQLMLIN